MRVNCWRVCYGEEGVERMGYFAGQLGLILNVGLRGRTRTQNIGACDQKTHVGQEYQKQKGGHEYALQHRRNEIFRFLQPVRRHAETLSSGKPYHLHQSVYSRIKLSV